jgi:hypothetical protein
MRLMLKDPDLARGYDEKSGNEEMLNLMSTNLLFD